MVLSRSNAVLPRGLCPSNGPKISRSDLIFLLQISLFAAPPPLPQGLPSPFPGSEEGVQRKECCLNMRRPTAALPMQQPQNMVRAAQTAVDFGVGNHNRVHDTCRHHLGWGGGGLAGHTHRLPLHDGSPRGEGVGPNSAARRAARYGGLLAALGHCANKGTSECAEGTHGRRLNRKWGRSLRRADPR